MVAVIFYCKASRSMSPAAESPQVPLSPPVANYLAELIAFPGHSRLADYDEYGDTRVDSNQLQQIISEHPLLRARVEAQTLPAPPSWVDEEWRGDWREIEALYSELPQDQLLKDGAWRFGWSGLGQLVDELYVIATDALRLGLPVIIAGD